MIPSNTFENQNFPPGSFVIVQSPPVSNNDDKTAYLLPKTLIISMTVLQIIASLAAIVMQAVLFDENGSNAKDFNDFGTGIWCGIFFLVPYIFGLIAALRASKACVIVFLVLSILSAILCFPMVLLSTFGAILSEHGTADYYNRDFQGNTSIGYLNQTLQDPKNIKPLVTYTQHEVWLEGWDSSSGNVFAYNPATNVAGPVCGFSWTRTNADVVCRQLGYSRSTEYYSNSYFGSVYGQNSYANVWCYGGESRLEDCSHDDYSGYCGQYDGAGVYCTSETTTTPPQSPSYALNVTMAVIGVMVFALALTSSILSCKVLCCRKRVQQGYVGGPPLMSPIQGVPVPLGQGPYGGMQFPGFPNPPPVYESINQHNAQPKTANNNNPRF